MMRSALPALFAILVLAIGSAAHAEEKQLNIYNWADYIGKDTIARFEQRTGIKVIYDTYDADATLEAKMMAGNSGYDIVTTAADYFARQIKAGVYEEIDHSRLSNWKNINPHFIEAEGKFDPGNAHTVPYLHSLNGFAYNVDMIRARMPDAPVDSLDMLFKPEIVSKFEDCGVTLLDSPEDVLQLALNYLHLDPNSTRKEDFAAAEKLLLAVRPYIRDFDSTEYLNGLPNKEVCLAMAWSADYATAKARAKANGININLAFTVPKEGANESFDALLIPKGAPHPEAAYLFLNYMMEPEVIAEVTNTTHFGNDNLAANPFVNPDILHDPAFYPTPELAERLYHAQEVSPKTERLRTRTWTRIKTGV